MLKANLTRALQAAAIFIVGSNLYGEWLGILQSLIDLLSGDTATRAAFYFIAPFAFFCSLWVCTASLYFTYSERSLLSGVLLGGVCCAGYAIFAIAHNLLAGLFGWPMDVLYLGLFSLWLPVMSFFGAFGWVLGRRT